MSATDYKPNSLATKLIKRFHTETTGNITVISGPPASGKTTELERMACQAQAAGKSVVPLDCCTTIAGMKQLLTKRRPDYATIDSDESEPTLAIANKVAAIFPNVHFIIALQFHKEAAQ
jgi:Cdc6-like AAA superfamily ATPase